MGEAGFDEENRPLHLVQNRQGFLAPQLACPDLVHAAGQQVQLAHFCARRVPDLDA
jgi:hypothetical protein